jgi:hypothetical protein
MLLQSDSLNFDAGSGTGVKSKAAADAKKQERKDKEGAASGALQTAPKLLDPAACGLHAAATLAQDGRPRAECWDAFRLGAAACGRSWCAT